jgi:hypothetical protein
MPFFDLPSQTVHSSKEIASRRRCTGLNSLFIARTHTFLPARLARFNKAIGEKGVQLAATPVEMKTERRGQIKRTSTSALFMIIASRNDRNNKRAKFNPDGSHFRA